MDDVDVWDSDTRMSACGFLTYMEKKEFKFLLSLFSTIFPKSDALFNILQNKSLDISYCSRKIDVFKNEIMALRLSFQKIWDETNATDDSLAPPPPKRQRVDFVVDQETSYRALYNDIIDNITVRIRERFSNLKELEFLALLNSENFKMYEDVFPEKEYQSLKNTYEKYFDFGVLKLELVSMYSYGDSDCYKRSISDLNDYFIISGLSEAWPNIFKLINLFLTIPATSAGVERSFSCLKRIHTFQRNMASQVRKSDLGLIALEKEYLNRLRSGPDFHSNVMNVFKGQKNRRAQLDFM